MLTVITFYKFVRLAQPSSLQAQLRDACESLKLLGTIHIASEGINATLAGEEDAIIRFTERLRSKSEFADVRPRMTRSETMPFDRLKVRLRDEIVTSGRPDLIPGEGSHVDPERWNDLLKDPDVSVIDVRNTYEHRLGTFPGSIDPSTASFRDFPAWAERWVKAEQPKTVAMFCTGGIRCEKAAAELQALGVDDVKQLDGGILGYLDSQPEENLWSGECFVFDDRVSVDRDLRPGSHEVCAHCRMPVMEEERQLPGYEPGVSCTHCIESLTDDRRAALRQRRDAAQGVSA